MTTETATVPTAEPTPTQDGAETLAWLEDHLRTNESEEPGEGPINDYNLLPREAIVPLAKYLLAHGERFVPATLPLGIPGGTPGACFCNTAEFIYEAAWRDRKALAGYLPEGVGSWDAQYVEGVCMNRKAPVLHAWGAFPKSQRVYDLTYGINDPRAFVWESPARFHHYGSPDDMAYIGLRVPREAVNVLVSACEVEGTGYPSILALPGAVDILNEHPDNPTLALLRIALRYGRPVEAFNYGKRGMTRLRHNLRQAQKARDALLRAA